MKWEDHKIIYIYKMQAILILIYLIEVVSNTKIYRNNNSNTIEDMINQVNHLHIAIEVTINNNNNNIKMKLLKMFSHLIKYKIKLLM